MIEKVDCRNRKGNGPLRKMFRKAMDRRNRAVKAQSSRSARPDSPRSQLFGEPRAELLSYFRTIPRHTASRWPECRLFGRDHEQTRISEPSQHPRVVTETETSAQASIEGCSR